MKIMKAIDFKNYIGCECLIFDSTDLNEGTPAIIEGIDIVTNKVICERANFEPEQIKPILKPTVKLAKYFEKMWEKDDEVKIYLHQDLLESCGFDSIDHMLIYPAQFYPYGTVQLFLNHKFDVFGLIEEDLAIKK